MHDCCQRRLHSVRLLFLGLGLALLTGCTSLRPIQGELRTKDGQAFLFSSSQGSLLLTPGKLTAFMHDQPASAESIRLKNDRGEILIPTRPENFQLNHFLISREQAKLSADIKGVWREQTIDVIAFQEFESCFAPGICPQSVEIVDCSGKDGKKRDKDCIRYVETRVRYAFNCPGLLPVENTYQNYTTSLEIEFLDAGNKHDRLAQFEGRSLPRKRLLTRRELGPCLVH